MKQIKTIVTRLNSNEKFDAAVNEALRDGWWLVKREVLQPPAQPTTGTDYFNTMLYAELEKDIITEDEKRCENCAHYDNPPDAEPCKNCSDSADKWEPAT